MNKNIVVIKGLAKATSIISTVVSILLIVGMIAMFVGALVLIYTPRVMSVELEYDILMKLDKEVINGTFGDSAWSEVLEFLDFFDENGELVQNVKLDMSMKKLGALMLFMIAPLITLYFLFKALKELADSLMKTCEPFSIETLKYVAKLASRIAVHVAISPVITELGYLIVLGVQMGSGINLLYAALAIIGYFALVLVLRYGIELRMRAEKAEAELREINELEEKYLREEEENRSADAEN